jgi:flavin reductase (DIM6/NTAB) family NADH-FMN oxidoreductase RutF
MLKKVPFERFHRLFYPQLAAVVTATDGEKVGGLLASSVMPVSFNPPKVAAALGKNHTTTQLVEKSQTFSVNWLSHEHVEKMELLAKPAAPTTVDKLKECGLMHRPGENTGAPILVDASAYLECRVSARLDAGDHMLYVAKVIDARASDDFGEYWMLRVYKPVLYIGSARPGWPKFVKFPAE